jgi:ribosomal 50S subunit-recycling heat shock protein
LKARAIRLDRFLWFARLAKTRSAAQAIAEKGTLRIDGRRIERSAAPVRIGSIIVFPLYGKVLVLARRGAAEAARTPGRGSRALHATGNRRSAQKR